jgi:hypothetical protein
MKRYSIFATHLPCEHVTSTLQLAESSSLQQARCTTLIWTSFLTNVAEMLRHHYLIPFICSRYAGKPQDHIASVIGFGCFVEVAILCCYSLARKLG